MAPLNNLPWTFGTNVEGKLTSTEVLTEAGLTWGVRKEPLVAHLTLPDGSTSDYTVRGKYTMTRDDINAVIGIVGKNYRGVPNLECSALLDSFAQEAEAKFEYAGSIGNGERVWFKVNLPKTIRIKDSEEIVSFSLMLTNAFNGSKSLEMHLVPILNSQAVTLNTNTHMADTMAIRHTNMYDTHIKEVRKVLRMSDTYFDSLGEMWNNLADIPIGKDKFQEVLDNILPLPMADPETGEQPNIKRAEAAREKLQELQDIQNETNPFPNTAWSTFIAIANYSDHERTFKKRKDEAGSQDELRLISVLEGTSQNLKNKAIDILLGK